MIIPKLKPCPPGGDGVHRWIYHVCCLLLEEGFDPVDIKQYCAKNASRGLQPNEVENACKSILHRPSEIQPRWRQPTPAMIRSAIREGQMTLEGLRRLSDGPQCAEDATDELFPGNPLLCCGLNSYQFRTKPRAEWRNHLHRLQFIVPSPMSSEWGETQSGKKSQHTLQNTGPRQFLVVEFDSGSFDDHASLLWYLGQFLSLKMVVHSGGKSLHGWFDVRDHDEKFIQNRFQVATSIGADPATWTRSQFVRMPGGRRAGGNLQEIVYFKRDEQNSNSVA